MKVSTVVFVLFFLFGTVIPGEKVGWCPIKRPAYPPHSWLRPTGEQVINFEQHRFEAVSQNNGGVWRRSWKHDRLKCPFRYAAEE